MSTPSINNQKPGFYYGYIIVAATFIVMMIQAGIIQSYGVFFVPLSTELGMTRSVTSGAFSVSLLIFGFLGIFTGKLTDRFGARYVVTACSLLLGLGVFLMSTINSIWQLYLFWGVMIAVGRSGCFVPLISTVARWFVSKRGGLMNGIAIAGAGAGIFIVPLVSAQLISAYDWRLTFVMLGIASFFLMVVAAQFLRNAPVSTKQTLRSGNMVKPNSGTASPTKGVSVGMALRMPRLWMLLALFFAHGFCTQAIGVHLVAYSTDLGISPVIAASFWAFTGGASVIGRIGGGAVSDRIGKKPTLILIYVLLLLALLWLNIARDVWGFYLFAIAFGIAWGGGVVLQSPVVAEHFGLASHGVILGIIAFAVTVGNATGPLLLGAVFDVTNSYRWGFVAVDIVAAVNLALALFLRTPKSAISAPETQ